MRQIFLAVLAAVFAIPAVAQTGSGLYMTAQDFADRRLSYAQERPGQAHKVKTDLAFRYGKIKVQQGDKVHTFRKNEVFGYRDAHNNDYRFVNNRPYKVLGDGNFYLYSSVVDVTKGKERRKETQYFFSARPGSEILRLTRSNLKQAFPDNRRFHDLLDLQFRSDKELAMYDAFHKEYKVQSLYGQALQQGNALNW